MTVVGDDLGGPVPAMPTVGRRFPAELRRWLVRLGYFGASGTALWTIRHAVERGRALQRSDPEVFLGAAPLVGRNYRDGWDWRFSPALLAAGAVAAAVVLVVERGWLERVRLRVVVVGASVVAGAFATSLALADGVDGLLHGMTDDTEYLGNLPGAPPAGAFVRTFVDRIDDYSVHVRGHPPGFVLVLKALAAVGLGGAWPAALLCLLATMVLVAATLTTVRVIAGDRWVRRAAPFLVLVPYVLWEVTSADAVYTAVGAAGIAAIVVGMTTDRRRSAVAGGLVGGGMLGGLLYLTYLGATYATVPLAAIVAVAIGRRRRANASAVVAAIVAVGAVVVGFSLAGFWWLDGVRRTQTEYWEGSAQFRHWNYFGYANLAAALLAVGPATFAGLLRLRDRRIWWLVGGAALALTISHLSQYTRGEVERIWLLFYPWLAVAGGALAVGTSRRSTAAWLTVQAGCAIALQAALVSKW